MPTVLILCTGNSCRSQMAHGYLKRYLENEWTVLSAGVEIHGVNPGAIKVMLEDGVDIREHTSNHVDEYSDCVIDYILTVCDNARESCPVFPAQTRSIHHSFPDPASARGDEETILNTFREVRDEIKAFCKGFAKHPEITTE